MSGQTRQTMFEQAANAEEDEDWIDLSPDTFAPN